MVEINQKNAWNAHVLRHSQSRRCFKHIRSQESFWWFRGRASHATLHPRVSGDREAETGGFLGGGLKHFLNFHIHSRKICILTHIFENGLKPPPSLCFIYLCPGNFIQIPEVIIFERSSIFHTISFGINSRKFGGLQKIQQRKGIILRKPGWWFQTFFFLFIPTWAVQNSRIIKIAG